MRENIDSKLANVRRDIIRNKRLTDAEIDQIRTQIRNEENVTSDEEEEQHSIENMNLEPIVLIPQLNMNEVQNRIAEVRNASINDEDPESQDNFTEQYSQETEEARLDILREFSRTEHQDFSERDPLPKITNSAKLNLKIKLYNVALKKILTNKECDLSNLSAIIYATGKAISNQMGVKTKKKKSKHTNKPPKWKVKIQKEIDALRAELSILDEISKGTTVKTRKAIKIRNRNNASDENSVLTAKETLKQKIQVKAHRLRRYDKRNRFYRQNKIFKTDAKKLYREIGKGTINIEEEWIRREEDRMNEVKEQEWEVINIEELRRALTKSHKWKSPGVDKIPNFWLNCLTSTHKQMALNFTNILQSPETAPEWLTQGTTYLLPNLLTFFLTSTITERMYTFLEENSILPKEQKGCKGNSYGCKDQLLINKMILENFRKKKRNLSTAWSDYKKAFDSVSHEWTLKAIELYKISPKISNFLRTSMSKWQTRLLLSHNNGTLKSDSIKIKRGIFQGDSLSPLLFCLALIPLSNELNNTGYGYKIFD